MSKGMSAPICYGTDEWVRRMLPRRRARCKVRPMRALVLLGGLIGGVAVIVLTVSGSGTPPPDPTGTGPVPVPSGEYPALGYLTGVLMMAGGVAIFWFPLVASVALGVAAALGIGSGILGDSQDQLMYGLLAVFLTAVAVVVVVREGRNPDQTVKGD